MLFWHEQNMLGSKSENGSVSSVGLTLSRADQSRLKYQIEHGRLHDVDIASLHKAFCDSTHNTGLQRQATRREGLRHSVSWHSWQAWRDCHGKKFLFPPVWRAELNYTTKDKYDGNLLKHFWKMTFISTELVWHIVNFMTVVVSWSCLLWQFSWSSQNNFQSHIKPFCRWLSTA